MLINEILNKKVDYKVIKQNNAVFATEAEIGDRIIRFAAVVSHVDGNSWEIEFSEHKKNQTKKTNGTYGATGSGNELQVFSMIKDSVLEFVSIYHPDVFVFTADKDENSGESVKSSMARANVYERLLKKFKIPGYTYERSDEKAYAEFVIAKFK